MLKVEVSIKAMLTEFYKDEGVDRQPKEQLVNRERRGGAVACIHIEIYTYKYRKWKRVE